MTSHSQPRLFDVTVTKLDYFLPLARMLSPLMRVSAEYPPSEIVVHYRGLSEPKWHRLMSALYSRAGGGFDPRPGVFVTVTESGSSRIVYSGCSRDWHTPTRPCPRVEGHCPCGKALTKSQRKSGYCSDECRSEHAEIQRQCRAALVDGAIERLIEVLDEFDIYDSDTGRSIDAAMGALIDIRHDFDLVALSDGAGEWYPPTYGASR